MILIKVLKFQLKFPFLLYCLWSKLLFKSNNFYRSYLHWKFKLAFCAKKDTPFLTLIVRWSQEAWRIPALTPIVVWIPFTANASLTLVCGHLIGWFSIDMRKKSECLWVYRSCPRPSLLSSAKNAFSHLHPFCLKPSFLSHAVSLSLSLFNSL